MGVKKRLSTRVIIIMQAFLIHKNTVPVSVSVSVESTSKFPQYILENLINISVHLSEVAIDID